MQWLAALCVRRPVFAAVLTLVIFVIGLAAYSRLGVDRFPKIDLPVVTIATRLPGAAPADVETELTDKIEKAVNTVGGIDELRSISAEGVSLVYVVFVLEKDSEVAAQEVRDRVSALLPDLPAGVELPVITKLDPDATPILYVALTSDTASVRDVTELADKTVARELESVPGVGQVRLLGGRKREIQVVLDPLALRARGVTAPEVARALASENLTIPGGRIDSGPAFTTLRIHGRVSSPEALGSLVVREQAGHPVRVRDVARIEDASEERQSAAAWNGEPTVVLGIRKQSGSNTVAVVDALNVKLDELRARLPAGLTATVLRDDSQVIRVSTHAVSEHLVVGAFLAAAIVLMFLGSLRSTLIAAVAIPTSIVGTFALMWARGYTLNTITLLALALAVGIVIDDAIVVLENIFKWIEHKGKSPAEAAVEGTREIGPAVLATTLSLIAVFLPIAFLGGIPGRFLSSFGITMAFSIVISLFVSFTLTPMMASRWLRPMPGGEQTKRGLEHLVDVFYHPVERAYMRVLQFCMRRRWVVVVASLLALAAIPPLGARARKGFLPTADQAQFDVLVRAPEGSSIAGTALVAERIARDIRKLPEVYGTLVTIGDNDQRTANLARIYVRLTAPEARQRTQEQLQDVVRRTVVAGQSKELRISVTQTADINGGGSTARFQYTLSGPDLDELQRIATKLQKQLAALPGADDVDSTLVVGKPELAVHIDRERAADLGVRVADVATALQMLVGGAKVSDYAEHGEQFDVRVRAEGAFRADATQLGLLTVPSSRLGAVPLSDVVTLAESTGPATIDRLSRKRQITLLANPRAGHSEGELVAAFDQMLKDDPLPSGFYAYPAGTTKMMGETARGFGFGFLLAFVFMYLVLAAQFESWLHPVTILITLPLTLPFAILSVILFDQALDIYSMLGIFVLFGVVKKNAILQIDHTNQLRAEGVPRAEAILRGNRDRLRPILMTTLAFVAGMLPLVTSKGIGAGFNRATAGVVVGGQTLSLLLTLLATPVFYSLFDDLGAVAARLWVRAFGAKADPGAAVARPE